MASRKLLVQINQMSIEISESSNDLPFLGLSVIACVDLHHLSQLSPPAQDLMTQDFVPKRTQRFKTLKFIRNF